MHSIPLRNTRPGGPNLKVQDIATKRFYHRNAVRFLKSQLDLKPIFPSIYHYQIIEDILKMAIMEPKTCLSRKFCCAEAHVAIDVHYCVPWQYNPCCLSLRMTAYLIMQCLIVKQGSINRPS
jgi:hypothetical protein